jgi:hypothetical protein
MQRLLEWTLEAIRAESSDFSWMEEYRYDWTPLIRNVVSRLMEGQSILLLTDSRRKWYSQYILSHINDPANERPFLPIYNLDTLFPHLERFERNQDIDLLEDMLSISYPQGYFIWYIGEGNYPYAKFAFRDDGNFLWLVDEHLPGSFYLSGSDSLLDIKLLQLYKLFNKTIEATLFGEIDIEE